MALMVGPAKVGHIATVESIYLANCALNTAISPHLQRLRALAEGLSLAVEFGVKRGASSSALLMGAKRVISYDIKETPEANELEVAAGSRWDYRIEDSRTADVPECELCFIDSLHTYAQMKAELDAHAHKVTRYLVAHDVGTFGEVGAVGETGAQAWPYVKGKSCPEEFLGIRPALDQMMANDPSWRIAARYTDSHGLLVLERR